MNGCVLINYKKYFCCRCGAQGWCRPSCIPITVILVLIVLVVLLPLLDAADKHSLNSTIIGNDSKLICNDDCHISLVESIPIGLNYSNSSVIHRGTYQTWKELIESAQSTIEIGSYYWTLRREDIYPDDSAKEVSSFLKITPKFFYNIFH